MIKKSPSVNSPTAGMAAGQYCDLISDCKVKVTVDGSGNAKVSPADPKDPFVAIIAAHCKETQISCVFVCVFTRLRLALEKTEWKYY